MILCIAGVVIFSLLVVVVTRQLEFSDDEAVVWELVRRMQRFPKLRQRATAAMEATRERVLRERLGMSDAASSATGLDLGTGSSSGQHRYRDLPYNGTGATSLEDGSDDDCDCDDDHGSHGRASGSPESEAEAARRGMKSAGSGSVPAEPSGFGIALVEPALAPATAKSAHPDGKAHPLCAPASALEPKLPALARRSVAPPPSAQHASPDAGPDVPDPAAVRSMLSGLPTRLLLLYLAEQITDIQRLPHRLSRIESKLSRLVDG
jgi:hypothetical protein